MLPRLIFDEETKRNLTKCIEDRADFWLVVTPGTEQSSKDLVLYLDKNSEFRVGEYLSFKKIELYKYARDSLVE